MIEFAITNKPMINRDGKNPGLHRYVCAGRQLKNLMSPLYAQDLSSLPPRTVVAGEFDPSER